MVRHGVWWCKHCGYWCIVKAPVNDGQVDVLRARFDAVVGATLADLERWVDEMYGRA